MDWIMNTMRFVNKFEKLYLFGVSSVIESHISISVVG